MSEENIILNVRFATFLNRVVGRSWNEYNPNRGRRKRIVRYTYYQPRRSQPAYIDNEIVNDDGD